MEEGFSNFFFTQGILGVCVLALGIVVVYQQRKIDKLIDKIQTFNDLLLSRTETHAEDFLELSKKNIEVLQSNSQNMALLGEKIQIARGKS